MQNAMAFNMILNIHERDLLSQQFFYPPSFFFHFNTFDDDMELQTEYRKL